MWPHKFLVSYFVVPFSYQIMCIIIFQLKISYMPLFFFWTWFLLEAIFKSLFIMFIVLGNSLFITFTSSQKPTVVNCDNSMKIWLNSTLTFPHRRIMEKLWWKKKQDVADFMTVSHFNIFPLVYKVFPNTCMGLSFEHTHSSVLLWLYLHNQENENQG